MYMVLIKNSDRTQNFRHAAVATKWMDGKPGNRCSMSNVYIREEMATLFARTPCTANL